MYIYGHCTYPDFDLISNLTMNISQVVGITHEAEALALPEHSVPYPVPKRFLVWGVHWLRFHTIPEHSVPYPVPKRFLVWGVHWLRFHTIPEHSVPYPVSKRFLVWGVHWLRFHTIYNIDN